jgi:hypothetical protein
VIVGKRKCEMRVQPSAIGVPALIVSSNVDHR